METYDTSRNCAFISNKTDIIYFVTALAPSSSKRRSLKVSARGMQGFLKTPFGSEISKIRLLMAPSTVNINCRNFAKNTRFWLWLYEKHVLFMHFCREKKKKNRDFADFSILKHHPRSLSIFTRNRCFQTPGGMHVLSSFKIAWSLTTKGKFELSFWCIKIGFQQYIFQRTHFNTTY